MPVKIGVILIWSLLINDILACWIIPLVKVAMTKILTNTVNSQTTFSAAQHFSSLSSSNYDTKGDDVSVSMNYWLHEVITLSVASDVLVTSPGSYHCYSATVCKVQNSRRGWTVLPVLVHEMIHEIQFMIHEMFTYTRHGIEIKWGVTIHDEEC